MLTTPSKTVKEHLSRAKSGLARDDMKKAVIGAVNALEHLMRGNIVGKDKYEIEVLLGEFTAEFNKHPTVKEYFFNKGVHSSPYVKHTRGKEDKLLKKFQKLEAELVGAEEQAVEEKKQKKLQKKEDFLHKGQELLDTGDHARGKGVLRRCAEAFGDEPGLLVDIAQRLYKAKLLREAGEFGVRAIEKFGGDPKGYSIAVRAYMAMREFEEAEKVFRAVLRRFGAHPRTYQSMAKMYLEWRKFDEAYDYAKQAVEADPKLKDAQKIMDKVGERIFSKPKSSGGDKQGGFI